MFRPPRSRLSGSAVLAGFALGGAVLYLMTVLAVTLVLGEELPTIAWAGFGVVATVAMAAAGGLTLFLVRASREAGAETARPKRVSRAGTILRVLVGADVGCSGAALRDALSLRAGGRRLQARVVAPSPVSPGRCLDSDLDAARATAQARSDETVEALAAAGVQAQGLVGSESPLEAIADALAVFPADEIVVATTAADRGNWLEQGVVERARALHGLPVSRLVLEAPLPVG